MAKIESLFQETFFGRPNDFSTKSLVAKRKLGSPEIFEPGKGDHSPLFSLVLGMRGGRGYPSLLLVPFLFLKNAAGGS